LDADVDVRLDADLEELRAASAELIADRAPLERVREIAEAGGRFDPELVSGGRLGWLDLPDPGIEAAAVVAGERGRALQPGPFVPTSVAAWGVRTAGSDELRSTVLPGLLAGEALASWAPFGPSGVWDPAGCVLATASKVGSVTLDGARSLVPDAGFVEWILVAAREGDGVSQLLVRADAPGLGLTQLDTLDLTRTLWDVTFDGVEVPASSRLGGAGTAGPQLVAQLDLAVALALAESVGTLDRLFAWTVDYAKERTAFGRPIGSFQSMKHLLADNSRLLETSKAVAAAAARAVATDPTGASETVSMAKAYVSGASIELAHACWQTFGGVAYKWDHDFHLYLRRLTADAALYGDEAWHNERICAINGL
jgi:alkylation response protein AidB-like acyl-CoA dehydrogenase